jgi:hypothetical protein
MPNEGSKIQHPKLRGEWAEMRFMARAAENGLVVTKPWGDSSHYDFIVDYDGQISRVQVKSTKCKQARCEASYLCDLGRNGRPYTAKQVDFFAIYVIPCNVWYILPIGVVAGETSTLTLSPNKGDAKYALYQEAWHLLRGKKAGRAQKIASTNGEDGGSAAGDGTGEEVTVEAVAEPVEERRFRIKWNPVFKPWGG